MKFKLPTNVYLEPDCVRKHAAEIAALGETALIVTGRSSAKKCGAMKDVTEALEQNGRSFVLFEEVEENPSVETVMRGRDKALSSGCDFIIAIGGGSPLDAGKAIALMAAQPEANAGFLYTKHENSRILPIVAIPTTCGTGSEVTGVSVLTNHETKTKGSIPYSLFPELALLDARYLSSLSHGKLCDTAVDALCHLMESALNSAASPFSRIFVKEGLGVWKEVKDVLEGTKEPGPEELEKLLYASCMAGMAIAHTGTSIPHAMSYAATYEGLLPHGRACGYYLPGFLKECGEEGNRILPRLAGFADTRELEEFIYRVCHMNKDSIPEDFRRETAAKLEKNTAKLKTSAVPMDREAIQRIAGV